MRYAAERWAWPPPPNKADEFAGIFNAIPLFAALFSGPFLLCCFIAGQKVVSPAVWRISRQIRNSASQFRFASISRQRVLSLFPLNWCHLQLATGNSFKKSMEFNYNQLRIVCLYQVDFVLITCRWIALEVFYFKSFDLNSIRWIVWPQLSTKAAKA
jgi:hypothetical protein